MKRIKATVQVTLTLPAGAELIQNFRDGGTDLGAHIKVGGKFFRPNIDWLVFRPRLVDPKDERKYVLGCGWHNCDDADFEMFLSDEDEPEHPYTLEEVD